MPRANHRNGTHHRVGNENTIIVLGKGQNGELQTKVRTVTTGIKDWFEDCNETMQAIIDEVGKETVEMLKKISPENEKGKHRGRYRKGWVYQKVKYSTLYTQNIIRNKTDPQLTHLLEFGHPIVRKGKVVGMSDPIPHIATAAKWAEEEMQKRINEEFK